jgi:hypothetical protein
MYSSSMELAIVTEFYVTEAHSYLDLTKEEYSITELSMVQRKMWYCELTLAILLHMKKENQHDYENKLFTDNMSTRTLT